MKGFTAFLDMKRCKGWGPYSQSYGFSSNHVQMWEMDHKEGWALKNWCFEIVLLEKTLLRVPWTARRSNQSILKEISPDYLLEELMLKLMLQYLRVPWTARRSNQSILKEISPEYSLEGLMLKLQYFGHLMQRTDSLEKTLTMTS